MTSVLPAFLQPACGHCRVRVAMFFMKTDSPKSSRWETLIQVFPIFLMLSTCAASEISGGDRQEGNGLGRQASPWAPYALPWAKDDSAGFKVITPEPSGQPTTWTQSVAASERRVSEQTLRWTEEPAQTPLSMTVKCSAQLWAHNKYPSNIFPHSPF